MLGDAVTFKAGFEESEMAALLEALHRTRNVRGEGGDLVTRRWDMDVSHWGLDRVLVKTLITATGVYPIGTLVILDTFELAIVTRANSDPSRPHQPEVQILADPNGVPLATPLAVILDDMDPATGLPKRTVIKTTDPARYDIRVADYVIT